MWWLLLCSWSHLDRFSKLKWSVIATVLHHHSRWLGQKTRPKCKTKTSRCSLFPALWAVCLASLIVLIGSLTDPRNHISFCLSSYYENLRDSRECDPWLRQFYLTVLSDWARKLAPNVVLQPNERDMWELLDEPGWLFFTRWLSSRFKITLAG